MQRMFCRWKTALVAGTILPAERYHATQVTNKDVKLGDTGVAQLMQTDAFELMVKNPTFRAMASDPGFMALALNPPPSNRHFAVCASEAFAMLPATRSPSHDLHRRRRRLRSADAPGAIRCSNAAAGIAAALGRYRRARCRQLRLQQTGLGHTATSASRTRLPPMRAATVSRLPSQIQAHAADLQFAAADYAAARSRMAQSSAFDGSPGCQSDQRRRRMSDSLRPA